VRREGSAAAANIVVSRNTPIAFNNNFSNFVRRPPVPLSELELVSDDELLLPDPSYAWVVNLEGPLSNAGPNYLIIPGSCLL
jgi:hypothetical protein